MMHSQGILDLFRGVAAVRTDTNEETFRARERSTTPDARPSASHLVLETFFGHVLDFPASLPLDANDPAQTLGSPTAQRWATSLAAPPTASRHRGPSSLRVRGNASPHVDDTRRRLDVLARGRLPGGAVTRETSRGCVVVREGGVEVGIKKCHIPGRLARRAAADSLAASAARQRPRHRHRRRRLHVVVAAPSRFDACGAVDLAHRPPTRWEIASSLDRPPDKVENAQIGNVLTTIRSSGQRCTPCHAALHAVPENHTLRCPSPAVTALSPSDLLPARRSGSPAIG